MGQQSVARGAADEIHRGSAATARTAIGSRRPRNSPAAPSSSFRTGERRGTNCSSGTATTASTRGTVLIGGVGHGCGECLSKPDCI